MPSTLRRVFSMGVLLLGLTSATCTAATPSADISAAVTQRFDQASVAQAGAVAGVDGWYYLTAELRSYSRGPFWGADAAKAALATKDQDPLAAIIAFDRMVKAAGITLIVVPVPGKVALNPDHLAAQLGGHEPGKEGRWDAPQAAFNAELTKAGVQVIDLVPDLIALRAAGTATHCRQDSHWSPAAMHLAAGRIAALVTPQPWYAGAAKRAIARAPAVMVATHGDLVGMLQLADVPAEDLTIEQVLGVEPDKASPVVLMGDSHTLVYHDRELLADRAGLPEHLAAELGLAVDLVGVRGSGANASRVALARRKDNLAGKKCLVWVFTARELTESLDGWKTIPVIR
jgi:alginate O-acetyltransferase complex protein AlgJ